MNTGVIGLSNSGSLDEGLIIKLGGSVITYKHVECSPRLRFIKRICLEISKLKLPMLLIHGAGSYAHPIVREYGIHLGYRSPEQLKAFTETCVQLRVLNNLILKELKKHDVPAAPIHPSSSMIMNEGEIAEWNIAPLVGLLNIGLTPLLHGDVVYDRVKGFSIVSGDRLATYLAEVLRPSMVVFGCDVDGVYDFDPKSKSDVKLLPKITPSTYRELTTAFKTPQGFDVTGGMKAKVEEAVKLAEKGVESVVINLLKPQNLTKLITGKPVTCTRITPEG
ncbi:MAG: isopentenyl phosphate kinase [Candidatus Bathyarchaeia archaeon]